MPVFNDITFCISKICPVQDKCPRHASRLNVKAGTLVSLANFTEICRAYGYTEVVKKKGENMITFINDTHSYVAEPEVEEIDWVKEETPDPCAESFNRGVQAGYKQGVNFALKILKACLSDTEYDKVSKKIKDALWEEMCK